MRSKGRKVPIKAKQASLPKYNLRRLQAHWWSTSEKFNKQYKDCGITFDNLIQYLSDAITRLEGKARLAENCAYLLLTKGINHGFAAYNLIERGLVIDAALCARNAVEVCLMLQLFVTDETEAYFEAWANDKNISPGEVRKRLSVIKEVAIRDVIVKFSDDHVEDTRIIYGKLSDITHANLQSLRLTVNEEEKQHFQVYVGGSIEGQEAMIRAIFGVICHYLLDAAVITMAILDVSFIESTKDRLDKLTKDIKSTVTIADKAR
jgi:hypothetical protein